MVSDTVPRPLSTFQIWKIWNWTICEFEQILDLNKMLNSNNFEFEQISDLNKKLNLNKI
jgi:hypothetical protein